MMSVNELSLLVEFIKNGKEVKNRSILVELNSNILYEKANMVIMFITKQKDETA